MKLNQKDVSTIVILNKNKPGTKTVQIKTYHIARFKYYLLTLVSVILLLVGSIIFLQSRNQQQETEKKQLLTQIVKLKGDIPANLKKIEDNNIAQSYVQAIEAKLKKINDYLRKRGLKGFSTKGVGGDDNAEGDKLSNKDVYMAYNDYLKNLVNTVAFTPMGYPRISSITSGFGFRSDPFNSAHADFHPGIDFKGKKGDIARCTANGKVISAGWNGGYGNCVCVQHENGFETLYGHLSRITVKVGQQVAAGEKIGEVGSTGHSTGPHLHYEIRKNGKAVNPINFLTLNN